MKKMLFTFLSMTILTFSYGQEIKQNKEKIPLPSSTITTNPEHIITLTSKHIIFENRLDLEADSAQYDSDKKILIAFGTKQFTFNGKVIVSEENGICTFYLGEGSSSLAIIED